MQHTDENVPPATPPRLNPLTSVAGQIKSAGCCGPCAPAVAEQRDEYVLGGGCWWRRSPVSVSM